MKVTDSEESGPASGQDDSDDGTRRPKPSPQPRPRPTPRAGTAHAEEPDGGESERGTSRLARLRPRLPERKAAVLGCLVVAFVLLASAAAWFALEANALREGAPEENSAIVDEAATAEVRKQVSSGVESLFSYNYSSLDRTRRAGRRVLLDEALKKYNADLDEASKAAEQHKLVRTTSVRAIGVRTLHDDTARVLLFLDQQTLATDSGEQDASTAYLDVVAKKVGGSWKIATMSG